jgi:hypothetical protein
MKEFIYDSIVTTKNTEDIKGKTIMARTIRIKRNKKIVLPSMVLPISYSYLVAFAPFCVIRALRGYSLN